MKRVLILLTLCVLFTPLSFVNTTFSANTRGNYWYDVNEDNTATITKYTGDEENLVIPETLDGHTVTKIDWCVFQGKSNLKSVEFNDSLIEIGLGCFQHCQKLEKVKFNKKLKRINWNAFNMTNLESIELPDSLTYLDGFSNTKIKNITLPAYVKTIGRFCFSGCPLTKVNLNKGLEKIEKNAFGSCESLKKIKFPDSLKYIESDAFCHTKITSVNITQKLVNISIKDSDYGVFSENLKKITVSKNNKEFSAKNGILYNKKKTELVYYPPNRRKAVFKTPKYIKAIGVGAFNQADIDKVTVTGNVKKVNKEAFTYCKAWNVVFKKGVKTIGKYAFEFSDIIEVKLPKGLKKIDDSTFSASSLKKVNIPKSVTSIDREAFFGTDIRKITVPSTVKKIGKYAIGIKYGECGSYGGVNKKTVIHCKKNSAAYKYAKKYKVKYKFL